MRNFFLFSVFYAVFAVVLLFFTREQPIVQLFDAVERTKNALSALWRTLPYLAAALGVLIVMTRQFVGRDVAKQAALALSGSLIFAAAFTFVKTSQPYVVPFYADPFFAQIDRALHGGVDPYVLTHQFAAWLPSEAISTLYFMLWAIPAVFFPLILALSDSDTSRKARFLVLFGFVWIGLGNIAAYLGSSAGPIYYDRLLETARFPGLLTALDASGIAASQIGTVQDGLWQVYFEQAQAIGSGISAFPSVHNAVATLIMLYLFERSKWLAPIGIAFCAAILFCSVHIGWHYAIDGYFSILAVTSVWWLQRKFGRSGRRNVAFASYTPA